MGRCSWSCSVIFFGSLQVTDQCAGFRSCASFSEGGFGKNQECIEVYQLMPFKLCKLTWHTYEVSVQQMFETWSGLNFRPTRANVLTYRQRVWSTLSSDLYLQDHLPVAGTKKVCVSLPMSDETFGLDTTGYYAFWSLKGLYSHACEQKMWLFGSASGCEESLPTLSNRRFRRRTIDLVSLISAPARLTPWPRF